MNPKLVIWPHLTPWRQGKHDQSRAQTEENPKYRVSTKSENIGEYIVNSWYYNSWRNSILFPDFWILWFWSTALTTPAELCRKCLSSLWGSWGRTPGIWPLFVGSDVCWRMSCSREKEDVSGRGNSLGDVCGRGGESLRESRERMAFDGQREAGRTRTLSAFAWG